VNKVYGTFTPKKLVKINGAVSKGDNGAIEAGALAVGLLAMLADLFLRLLEYGAARYSGRTTAPAGGSRRAAA
jgi:hypothetical protein